MSNIAAAFVKAQRGFAPALKDKTNPHFKSKYVDLASCVEAVIDSLHANGIALIQKTFADETGVTVGTIFLHESGETIDGGMLHVPAAKQDPQGYGSALTYARRYSLMAACGIAPEDDDGNAASRPRPQLVDTKTGEILTGQPVAALLEQSIEQSKQKRAGVMAAVLPAIEAYLDDATKVRLSKLAKEVMAQKESAQMYDRIEIEELGSEEKTWLWSLLPSNVRSALKRENDTRSLKKETA
jgi:hypothetical protein